ncbi:hypothetical protein RTCIAT899_PB02380 (plasmid) [Rhizobium tropici CIAT 899]|nr:hypothetical protein RTCIAT899_PB02380 [Rhizobium tropici CIAT 899]
MQIFHLELLGSKMGVYFKLQTVDTQSASIAYWRRAIQWIS